MAPEMFISGKPYGPNVDNWSLGVVMHSLLSNEMPACSQPIDAEDIQKEMVVKFKQLSVDICARHIL